MRFWVPAQPASEKTTMAAEASVIGRPENTSLLQGQYSKRRCPELFDLAAEEGRGLLWMEYIEDGLRTAGASELQLLVPRAEPHLTPAPFEDPGEAHRERHLGAEPLVLRSLQADLDVPERVGHASFSSA